MINIEKKSMSLEIKVWLQIMLFIYFKNIFILLKHIFAFKGKYLHSFT